MSGSAFIQDSCQKRGQMEANTKHGQQEPLVKRHEGNKQPGGKSRCLQLHPSKSVVWQRQRLQAGPKTIAWQELPNPFHCHILGKPCKTQEADFVR